MRQSKASNETTKRDRAARDWASTGERMVLFLMALAVLGGLPPVCLADQPPAGAETADPGAAEVTMAEQTVAETPRPGSDWPRFLGPTADGRSSEKILLDWGEHGPAVLWYKAVGEGYSAPSVADGRVFVFDRVGDEARLMAWDAATGEDLWMATYPSTYEDMYRYSGGPRASPVIDGERVFIHGVDGRLRAHAVGDGELLWEIDTVARYGVVQNFFGVGSTPVVEGDLLMVMIGGSPADSPKITSGEVRGHGSAIVAFDKATGEERYRLSDELASYATPRLVEHGGRRWGFAFTRGGLLAFEPTTGKEDFFYPWRAKKLESVNAATPVVVGDRVLVSESYGPGTSLLRFGVEGPEGYELVWKDPPRDQSLQQHWSTPIYDQGILYASSGQSSGEAELRAVEMATGKVLWREGGLGRSTLLWVDDHLLVLTEKGQLLLLEADPERYAPVAQADFGVATTTENEEAKTGPSEAAMDRPRLRFPVWNAPVLSHGRLYLRGRDQVVVLDLAPKR